MPRNVCCVPGCPVVAEDGIPLHYFPNPEKEAVKFQDWIKSIGGGIASLDSNLVYKTQRVCRQHFQDVFLYPKNRLSKLAVPSLHLPSEDVSAPSMDLSSSSSQQSTSQKASTNSVSARTIKNKPCRSGVPVKVVTKTQQPGGNDKAVVKRALNETMSIRGEYKRPRQSHAQAASESLNVAITCDRRGIISQGVSNQVIAAIQKQIISEACSPMQDTPGPTFNANPLFAGGVLRLWCGNDHTLAWLKKTVFSLALPASTSQVVKSQSEIQKRVRCGIAIPDDQGFYEDSTFIGRALCYQNPWIDVKKWEVLHAEKQRACWFVVLDIPEGQVPSLLSSERRLSIGLGSVHVKFQGPNGRFVDVPWGWNPVTRQLVDPGEIIPPTNNPEATVAESADPAATVDAIPSSGGGTWTT